jgi:hypothetical protein
MKKIAGLFIVLAALTIAQSCRKEDQGPTVSHQINVSLKANESYSFQIPHAGDADDVMQIKKQAIHSSNSQVSPVANSTNTLFEYTPAVDFTGSDEVVVASVEGTNGHHGHHNGQCNGNKNHEGTTIYDFKITITAAN